VGTSKWIFLAAATVLVLWYALTRDIRYAREYMGDLRNRVVGARIIEDHGSPYFYKWQPGDSVRYYDPQAFDIYTPSISTSTPFLHRLLMPVADLPFAAAMRVWLVVLYVLYFAMVACAIVVARDAQARLAVVLVALLFLLTNAWALHTKYGQTYLLIPALGMLVFTLRRRPWLVGWAAAALVAVRPNAVLALLPFVFMRGFKGVWVIPGVIALFWVFVEGHDRELWSDYRAMVYAQVQIHQELAAETRPAVVDPGYVHWEGLDMDTVRARIMQDPVHIYSENGNLFVLYRKMIGHRMPLALLGVLGVISIVAVMAALVVVRRRSGELEPAQLAIIGFCLYMISDLLSPIYRHAYYGVQWILPLLLAASLYRGRLRWPYGMLLICLLLNIVHLPFIPMGNTIGEYGFLIGLLAIGFAQRVENLPRAI
jgi:hypothetical protein